MKKGLFLSLLILLFSYYTKAQPVGLIQNSPQSYNGYTAFSGYNGDTVYLIDNCGKLVHKWACSERSLRNPVYVLPNGDVLYGGKVSTHFGSGAGLLERVDWNGNIQWSYTIADSIEAAHHGFVPMPNGNVLAVVWEKKSVAEQILAGRDPATITGELWSEKIVEITAGSSPKIAWEWRLWDHLIQEFDPTKNNYGSVKDHPELVDVNLLPGLAGSWAHVNSIDYNPALDQIVICSRNFCELFIIDHSTTSSEAASHTGGVQNKGGDFLYRWGNPMNYKRGVAADQHLFRPHDGHWTSPGAPNDSGKLIVFNNGDSRPGMKYSTVEIIAPPLKADQSYHLGLGNVYLPSKAAWIYPKTPDSTFFSVTQGSAQLLPNGNVLIAESNTGEFKEVDSVGTLVWYYVCPINPSGIIPQGDPLGDNSVFMIRRYPVNYSAFAGRTLSPGAPIEIKPTPYNCSLFVSVGETEPTPFSFVTFPNPTSDKIHVQYKSGQPESLTLRMIDLSGRIVFQQTLPSMGGEVSIPVTKMTHGIYVLEAVGKTQKIQRKVLVQ
ncbi:MAG TPA: aryl-sulfate sulfotransferase [Flavipsychrobacter sp.]|nr:aryl-sulfate sulfotransferase [Flavipsychrobacter sp.]